MFAELRKQDPYRLENIDAYSNILYVMEMASELSHLAHQATEVDRYRAETCCVIGAYPRVFAVAEAAGPHLVPPQ